MSVAKAAANASGQLWDVAQALGDAQSTSPSDGDFARAALALVSAMRALKETEAKAARQDLSETVRGISSRRSSKEELTRLLKVGRDLLGIVRERASGMGEQVMSAHGALETMARLGVVDTESALLTLVVIVRFIARIFPDGVMAEGLLRSLTEKVIHKTNEVFREARDAVDAVLGLVAGNLEGFSDQELPELNFFLAAATNIDDLDPETGKAVVQYHTFFRTFCAISSALERLLSLCPDCEANRELFAQH